MKIIKPNAMRLLEKEGIPYTHHTFAVNPEGTSPEDIAAQIGRPLELIFKTLVTVGHSKANYVFCLPILAELDLKKAAKAAGEKNIELIDPKDLLKVAGYERGGTSPIGMRKLYPTFLEKTGLSLSQIIVSAGKRGHQLELSPRDLLAVTQGTAVDLLAETRSIF
jgi:Cys-tRNA(Pro)/Cys-tRNA(Cys) deacylase